MNETRRAPELEPHCGSWIISDSSGRAFETFYRTEADMWAAQRWDPRNPVRVETAAQYLSRINAAIKGEICHD